MGYRQRLSFTRAAWLAFCIISVLRPATADETAGHPWYRRSLVGMEVGPTGAQFGHSDSNDARYCSQFNGREVVRRCVSAHCDYLVIGARDGDYAYYDSKLLPKAPGLGERDPLQETVDEAARHRLPVIAYCVVQQGGHYLREHPEFEMRDPAGNRIGRFCYNSGYLDAMKQMVDKTGFDGWLDPVAYDRIGAAFKDTHAKREHFGHAPIAGVGIYFSSRTRDWLGREQPADYFQSFQGAHKALVYEHIPWGIVLDENVTLDRLREFPVVLLPHAAILSDREVRTLADYVHQGGNVILTGWSGLLGWRGEPREESALSELAGVHVVRRLDSLDNWVCLPGVSKSSESATPLSRGIAGGWPFLVKGPAVVLEATSSEPVGELLQPFRTTRQREGKESTDWPMSADAPVGPAVLVNKVGKGRVLTLACSPDYATASEHHIVEARCLLANAVRFLNPHPRVCITAPTTVEAVVTDDPTRRTLRIHLLGYNSPPQTTPPKGRPHILPGLIEDAPTYRVTVELSERIKRAAAFNKSTDLKRRGRRLEATINDIHDVLIVNY